MAEIPSFYDASFEYSLHDNNFLLAFGVQNYLEKISLDSPDYIMWEPQLVTIIDGVEISSPLDFHKCDEEDFALFNPVAKKSEKELKRLKNNNVLYCFNQEHFNEIKLFGEDEKDDHSRIVINMLPCIEDLQNGVCVNRTLE